MKITSKRLFWLMRICLFSTCLILSIASCVSLPDNYINRNADLAKPVRLVLNIEEKQSNIHTRLFRKILEKKISSINALKIDQNITSSHLHTWNIDVSIEMIYNEKAIGYEENNVTYYTRRSTAILDLIIRDAKKEIIFKNKIALPATIHDPNSKTYKGVETSEELVKRAASCIDITLIALWGKIPDSKYSKWENAYLPKMKMLLDRNLTDGKLKGQIQSGRKNLTPIEINLQPANRGKISYSGNIVIADVRGNPLYWPANATILGGLMYITAEAQPPFRPATFVYTFIIKNSPIR